MRKTNNRRRLGSAGMTLPEILIGVIGFTIIAGVGFNGYRQFYEATTVRRAAAQFAQDLNLTRSAAIQRRSTVSLVVDRARMRYMIRDTSGAVLLRRYIDDDSDFPLDGVKLSATGDSVSFNSRGLLVGSARVEIAVARGSRSKGVAMTALGRTKVVDHAQLQSIN